MSRRHNPRFRHIVKCEGGPLDGMLPCFADACVCLATKEHFIAVHVYCVTASRYNTVIFIPCGSHAELAKVIPYFHTWYYLPYANGATINSAVIILAQFIKNFIYNSGATMYKRVATYTDIVVAIRTQTSSKYSLRPVFMCVAVQACTFREMFRRQDFYFTGQTNIDAKSISKIDLSNPPPEIGNGTARP